LALDISRDRRFLFCGFGNCPPCCHGYVKADLQWLLCQLLGRGLTTVFTIFSTLCPYLPLRTQHGFWVQTLCQAKGWASSMNCSLRLPAHSFWWQNHCCLCSLQTHAGILLVVTAFPFMERQDASFGLRGWGWNRQQQFFCLLWLWPRRWMELKRSFSCSLVPFTQF